MFFKTLRISAAITRRGRFDMQLFVGTPNLESRVVQLQQKLAGRGLDDETEAKAIPTYRRFLESVWVKDAMFMNYVSEEDEFCSCCAEFGRLLIFSLSSA